MSAASPPPQGRCAGGHPGGAERHLQIACAPHLSGDRPAAAGFPELALTGCWLRLVYLDATLLKCLLGKVLQAFSRTVVVAMVVNSDGRRELLGLKVGDSETEGF